ncbi:MAG TPA: hypothetical protein DEW46_12885, partial [Verrucomicrobia bacterium]|nr:hypothetical protein [Verrucomicrobiota bacterium]
GATISDGLRVRMGRTPAEIAEGAEIAEDYRDGGMQKHRSCFLRLLWSVSRDILQKIVWTTALDLPISMARSKTPPRPLREALRMEMGGRLEGGD